MRPLPLAFLAITMASTWAFSQARLGSWGNLQRLQPGHKIKIVDMSFKAWQGRLISVSDGRITIREKRQHQEVTIERTKVMRVVDLQRSHRAGNAAIGFLVGALFGGTRDTEGDAYKAVLAGWFGGMGAAAGAAIPHPRPTVYRAKPARKTTDGDPGGSNSRQ